MVVITPSDSLSRRYCFKQCVHIFISLYSVVEQVVFTGDNQSIINLSTAFKMARFDSNLSEQTKPSGPNQKVFKQC